MIQNHWNLCPTNYVVDFIKAREGSLDISTLIEFSGERGKLHFQVCFFSENIEFKWIFEIGRKVLLPRSRDPEMLLIFHSAFLATM